LDALKTFSQKNLLLVRIKLILRRLVGSVDIGLISHPSSLDETVLLWQSGAVWVVSRIQREAECRTE
jgi:hypothetical protein